MVTKMFGLGFDKSKMIRVMETSTIRKGNQFYPLQKNLGDQSRNSHHDFDVQNTCNGDNSRFLRYLVQAVLQECFKIFLKKKDFKIFF